jgi:expansin (peptidoglycan-binding protein)
MSRKCSILHYSATFFYQGGNAGACGTVHSDNDYICAIDQARYGDSGNASPLCGQQVKITNTDNGNTVTVTIADDCPTCDNSNSIDLSVAAFEALGSLSEGLLPSMSSIITY